MAVADNVPNRIELLTLLLTAGADPNLVIDSDEGPPLRPVLAEYIASIEQPSPVVVKLLLRFGAKVSKVISGDIYKYFSLILTSVQT